MDDSIHSNMDANETSAIANGMTSSLPGSDSETSGTPEKRKRASAKKYKSFDDAKKYAHGLSLKSRKEWREYVKGKKSEMSHKPDDIPAHPDGIYKTKGWQGWRNWLGTEKPSKENLN